MNDISEIAPGQILAGDLMDRAGKVNLLILDVDGVLTDGQLVYGDKGEELKYFHVRDGLGIRSLIRGGVQLGIISGRTSPIISRRAAELGITIVYEKATDKLVAYDEIKQDLKISDEEIGYIGDDLLDIPLLKRVGLAVTVADGMRELKAFSHYITQKGGGRGAVREVCEIILKAKGLWEELTQKYYK